MFLLKDKGKKNKESLIKHLAEIMLFSLLCILISVSGASSSYAASSATFKTGKEINAQMKALAAGSDKEYSDVDSLVTSFTRASSLTNSFDVSEVQSSGETISMWYDSTSHTIYWYTKAKVVYMPADSSYMFSKFLSLKTIDLSGLITANVKDLSFMFQNTGYSVTSGFSISGIENWDVTSVTSTRYMFEGTAYGSSSGITIDLSGWKPSSLTSLNGMFADCKYLKTVYVGSDWVLPSGAAGDYMFTNCTSLKGGNGTSYSAANTGVSYAVADKSGTKGYFTLKASSNPTVTFTVQPMSKNIGRYDTKKSVSVSYSDGTFAKLSQSCNVYLQYQDDNYNWQEAGIDVACNGDGTIESITINSDSELLNKTLRLYTEYGVASDIFVIGGNYSTAKVPDVLYTTDAAHELSFNTGDTLYLVPNIDTYKKNMSIVWQVSTDHGKSYKDIETVDSSIKASLMGTAIKLTPAYTGYLYRYYQKGTITKTYSDPYEIFVFEKYEVDGTNLKVTEIGDDGSVNIYTADSRLAGCRPWESLKDTIKSISFGDNVTKTGTSWFKFFSKLEKVDFNKLTYLENSTFYGCGIKSITIPATVTYVGRHAFMNSDLIDIRFLNPDTEIYNNESNEGDKTIPESTIIYGYEGIARDDVHAVSSTKKGSTAYDYATKYNRTFYPIGVIGSDGIERYVEWDYVVENDVITRFKANNATRASFLVNGLNFYIPPTIDGYSVAYVDGHYPSDSDNIICGLQEHEHSDSCYNDDGEEICGKEEHTHDDSCREGDYYNVFGFYVTESPDIDIDNLYIPEGIEVVSNLGLKGASSIDNIYDYSSTHNGVDYKFTNNTSSNPNGTLYSYSSNNVIRDASSGYKFVLLDGKAFTGSFGETTYTIDLNAKSLTISGNGKTDSLTAGSSAPFSWAFNEITKIVIGEGVTQIGENAFASLTKVVEIENRSKVLEKVADTAFEGCGLSASPASIKTCTTYVNNGLYDAITAANAYISKNGEDYDVAIDSVNMAIKAKEKEIEALNEQLDAADDDATIDKLAAQIEKKQNELDSFKEQIEKIEEQRDAASFKFVFLDTEIKLNDTVTAIYSAADRTLTLKGTDDDGAMPEYTSDSLVPWRAVNSNIQKLIIESSITKISANSFFNMTSLKSVYNYGRNQSIVGSGELFDVIERKVSSNGDGYIKIDVPGRTGETLDAYQTQLLTIGKMLKSNGVLDISDRLLARTLSCNTMSHTHSVECEDSAGNVVCGIEEHAHTDSCYASTGDAANVAAGTYYIPKDATEDEIYDILTSGSTDADESYIVPVYAMGDSNEAFCNKVPSEENGYKLMDIFKIKGQCGDSLFYYISQDDTLVIEGTGEMYDFEKGNSPWNSYIGVITEIKLPSKLTSIGNFAFEGMELVTKVDIPDAVKSIGIGAFIDCVNLYTFDLKNVADMGGGDFSGCTSLETITLNSNFKITNGVLFDAQGTLLCYLRNSLFENADKKTYYTLSTNYEVPQKTKAIAEYAFYKAINVGDIVIPESVTMIKDYAFAYTPSLNSIHNNYESKQTIAGSALTKAGYEIASGKYVMVYKANTDFTKLAKDAEYKIIYNDEDKIDHVAVAYTGDAVAVGKSLDANKLQIAVVYVSNKSEVLTGTDSKISLSRTLITTIGDNTIEVYFNDGYGQEFTSTVVIEGKNASTGMDVSYKGATLYYNDTINLSDIVATITYADGSTKSITGTSTYTTSLGKRKYLSLDKEVVSTVGDNVITVTYLDEDGTSYSKKIKIKALNYLKEITATYDSGATIEVSKGTEGLDEERLKVELTWADGTFENVKGSDGRIYILTNYTVSGDKLIFEVTCTENNPSELVAGFDVSYENTVKSVDFMYIGDQVTKNMTFSFADVELTIRYSDDTVTKVRGDSVSGLTADHTTVQTADSTEEVELYYEVGGQKFTGKIYVPGKIREPLKLIVVTRPKKTVYQSGDTFDKTGMVVNCLYNDGNTEDVTDKVTVDGGLSLNSSTKIITLTFTDNSSGATVRTNMSINVNEFQKEMSVSRNFSEQYEIKHVYFRTKMTQDLSTGIQGGGDDSSDDEEDGEWIEITPANNSAVFNGKDNDGNDVSWPDIKTGYGFELKVYTQYKTDRGGQEFTEFLKKSQWDGYYTGTTTPTIPADEVDSKWKYLNDVYPQYTPTSNPDVLYLRILNGNISVATGGEQDYTEFDGKNFIMLERTDCPIYVNADDENPERIDEGEWYNSTKIFELPSRDVMGDGIYARRVYVSTAAANNNLEYTTYGVQIISPAWYGYEPEPVFSGDKFHFITEDGVGLERKKMWAPGKKSISSEYLHVCCQFGLRVRSNDDVRTHILQ